MAIAYLKSMRWLARGLERPGPRTDREAAGNSGRRRVGSVGGQQSGPGQWFRLLLDVAFDEHFGEQVVGLSCFEPGSFSPRHPHRTAHRFLFLDGEADDELVFPDGARHTAHRAKGDFFDYPHPVEHQTFSGTGCTILFVHERLPAAEE
ncbi:hypothetical protein ABZX95_21915 [Streptomyces sp. NPDC004232]|uniref:hypothetical protein n=1 Tax=Streptomyces sp. NPDC004232 TaxID=3154454 RepID=UPI001DCF412D|nr:hypothetical protein [Streptomyces sp. tea 10]